VTLADERHGPSQAAWPALRKNNSQPAAIMPPWILGARTSSPET
jgi:hypothetical protein